MTSQTAEKRPPAEPTLGELKVLSDRFWNAYKALREAWMKTGGTVDLDITFRDAEAEAKFQRRSQAAMKGAAKRKRYARS